MFSREVHIMYRFDTPEERSQGLRTVPHLSAGYCALLTYPEPRLLHIYNLGVQYPIYVVFVRPDRTVDSVHMLPRDSHTIVHSRQPCQWVLELPVDDSDFVGVAGQRGSVIHFAPHARPHVVFAQGPMVD